MQAVFCLCLFTLPLVAQDGAASLTGKVKDITGAGVPRTIAELSLENARKSQFRVTADSNGVFNFSQVPAGTYTLKLLCPGFRILILRTIKISVGEQKRLPVLQLEVGSMADCGGHAVRDAIRLLASNDHRGNLVGSVRLDEGPMEGNSLPVVGASVTVRCSTAKPCGATKTDSNGEFRFNGLAAGSYSVLVERVGFYPLYEPGYTVEEGIESIYYSVYIERCSGNCDPRLRPKKPIATCQ